MSRKPGPPRWFGWLMLGIAGLIGGWLLGELVAGGRLGHADGSKPSYADLSANPNAMPADTGSLVDCFDCTGNYGAASRLRASREVRGDEAFRELGAVELDTRYAEPSDEYRYGGAFPEPEPGPDLKLSLPVDMAPATPEIPVESSAGDEKTPLADHP